MRSPVGSLRPRLRTLFVVCLAHRHGSQDHRCWDLVQDLLFAWVKAHANQIELFRDDKSRLMGLSSGPAPTQRFAYWRHEASQNA
jgi:hypothetical protein